jgi:AraC-like DNA-binding protein
MQNAVILRHWCSVARQPARHVVLPDGCRDLIVRQRPGERPEWFVSDLGDVACHVALVPGLSHRGFRLHPGARIDHAGLLASMREDLDNAGIAERLHHHVTALPRVSEALAALSAGVGPDGGVARVAARLGVQNRSLQRLLARETGRAPVFWMRLARVRMAAAEVGQATSLAELAHDRGFADQAHMTREMRHWLGVTPRRIRLDPGWVARHLGPGYGV